METHFQTSFIPKKPVISASQQVSPSPHQSASLLMVIGVIVFIISILLAGGAYGWKSYLVSQRESYKKTLEEHKKQFKLDLITTLKQTDAKIDLAKQILNDHIATTLILDKLGRVTSDGIRFTTLDLNSAPGKGITLGLNGYGPSYKVVAFQSDLFSHLEDYGLRGEVLGGVVTNPIQNQNSTVSFDMTASINSDSVSYKRTLTPTQ